MKRSLFLLFTIGASCSTVAQNTMIVPPAIGGGTYSLTLQTGSHDFYSGVSTNTMGVNGDLLGPTLIMESGNTVDVTFDNQLGEPTTIHWHGMHVSAENDGGPHTVINAGDVWNPQFTVLDKAATYWYHPHLHEHTNEHVQKGIAGFVIVRDNEEAALDLPRTYGEDDFPIVFQTKAFDGNGQVVVDTEMDTAVLANGTVNASLDLPAQVVRLRLLNGASQRSFNIALSNNAAFDQIATDGGLLEAPVSLTEMLLVPGERAEILLDLSSLQGQNFSIVSKASNIPNNIYGAGSVQMGPSTIPGYANNPLNGADFTLLNVSVVAPTPTPVTTVPSSLVTLNPWLENDADVTRNLTLSPEVMGPTGMVNGPFVINNQSFDINEISQIVQLDDIEIWEISNQSGVAHPFHIHDVQFFILDINGNTPPANQLGRKDVVLVRNQQTVRFIAKFEDFADAITPYMYHCHMLTHEDDGMMGQFIVVDGQTSVDELDEGTLSIYPNPINGNLLQIRTDKHEIELVELYSMEGKLLQTFRNQGTNALELDVSSITSAFLLRASTVNGKQITRTIINQNQ